MVVFVKVILLCSSTLLSWTLEGENVCKRTVSKSGKIVLQKECCSGFMENNNKYIECLPGFHRTNCNIKCPPGYYGSGCLGSCQCDDDTEYCHHVCVVVSYKHLYQTAVEQISTVRTQYRQSLCV
ncbi:uncharacterized protein LOC130054767 [Ostrea edulis]|uniref:uncharacterized protein LOC130054767 n=1 Tax=Ostrea edulis TaxID=37623 RepID=UPI0024AE9F2C|nr:uncharacterized protein LOC130054767 [Ostrea edulis]